LATQNSTARFPSAPSASSADIVLRQFKVRFAEPLDGAGRLLFEAIGYYR